MTAPENDTELSETPEDTAGAVTGLPESQREEEASHRERVGWWRLFRHWLARSKTTSKYWVPRVGDRVRLHGRGTWLVYAVWIRRGQLQLGGPRIQRLADVTPATREDLDSLYGTPDWGRAVERSHSILTPTTSGPTGPKESEEESPRLRPVPALDDTAGDGHETEFE